jgi:hypothetical protein
MIVFGREDALHHVLVGLAQDTKVLVDVVLGWDSEVDAEGARRRIWPRRGR